MQPGTKSCNLPYPVTMTTPTIRVSDEARREIQEATASGDGTHLRITIGAHFEHDLSLDTPGPDDLIVDAGGLRIIVDPNSASRADGLSIEFRTEGGEPGFVLDNPNQPAVREVSAPDLQALLRNGTPLELIDVRTDHEQELARIPGATLLDQSSHDRLLTLERDTLLVFHCHHGIRSRAAAEYFLRHGFTKLLNLSGGIDAWSQLVDPTVPRY